MPKFTQEQIDEFKDDLQDWYVDYQRDLANGTEEGEWEHQLDEVFKAGYGEENY